MIKLNTLFLFCMAFTGMLAQQNTLSSGSDASGTGGSVSYSVGQAIYSYVNSSKSSVAQGVQQPYEISVITSLEGYSNLALQCAAYPNPASDHIKLVIGDLNTESLVYQLYDINGKLLESKNIIAGETIIFLSNLNQATYFLRVNKGEQEIKQFKIIKN